MKKSIVFFFFSVFLLFACKKDNEPAIKSNLENYSGKNLHFGEKLELKISSKSEKIHLVSISINDKKVPNKSLVLDSLHAHYGFNSLHISVNYADGKEFTDDISFSILPEIKEKNIPFKIVQHYNRNPELFTEGFFLENGFVYESSGLHGKSMLVKYKLGDIEFIQIQKQDSAYFSEGISKLGNTIYQLTWQQRKVFLYDAASFKLLKTLDLPAQIKEGWGMTVLGDLLVVSDGTQNLFFLDKDLIVKKIIQVVGSTGIYSNLNELEFLNGKIYANIWQKNLTLMINPENGMVEGKLDLDGIFKLEQRKDVLNGIASKGKNLLITGKYWTKIYELGLGK